MADILKMIVHRDRKLIGEQSVAPLDHNVAHLGAEVLSVVAHDQIIESHYGVTAIFRQAQASGGVGANLTLATMRRRKCPRALTTRCRLQSQL